MWLETRTPPGDSETQSAHRQTEQTSETGLKQHITGDGITKKKKKKKVPANDPHPSGGLATQTSPPKTLISKFPCSSRQDLLKLKGWEGESQIPLNWGESKAEKRTILPLFLSFLLSKT